MTGVDSLHADSSRAAVATKRNERRTAVVACGAHALHDGYTDLIYVLLPIWQKEFGIGYAELGVLRAMYSGTMAGLQIPSGLVAERLGAAAVLAAGTSLAGIGYCLAGASTGVGLLMITLFLCGLGSSTQHPLASAAVAHAFAGPRSMRAIGAYNFAGDIGKMAIPAAAALLLVVLPWRAVLALLGSLGLLAGLGIFLLLPRAAGHLAPLQPSEKKHVASSVVGGRLAFPVLISIGVIDSATRMGFLLFLPFLLTAKGASVPTLGLALSLVFVGGAAGKLVCGFLGTRIGAIATVWLTEGLTALLILVLLPLPLSPALMLLPLTGVALNGTSSVLYGSVPDVVSAPRRARAFSLFYTATIGAGAISPVLYGAIGDALGVGAAITIVACVVLLALPLSLALRPSLASVAAHL